MRTVTIGILTVLCALGGSHVAEAHSGDTSIRAILDHVPPELDGITVQLGYSVAQQLVLSNPTDQPVEILEPDGTPFLSIGPEGVLGNLNAAAWFTTNDPFGETSVPQDLVRQLGEGTTLPPRWGRVSREPSWGWFDHRLHPGAPMAPSRVVEAGVPADLEAWAIPVRYRGKTLELKGRIVYRPLRGGFSYSLAGGERTVTPVPGIELSILEGRSIPAIFMKNTSGQEVVVFGSRNEPFLRITSAGVESNLHSPTWLDVLRSKGEAPPDAAGDPAAPPQWSLVTSQDAFAWPEPRGSYGAEEPGDDVIRLGVPVDVLQWEIPFTVGGQRHVVEAVTQWVPAPDVLGERKGRGSSLPAVRAGLAVAAVLVLVFVEVRRRRRLSR